jgi:VanZ family protein
MNRINFVRFIPGIAWFLIVIPVGLSKMEKREKLQYFIRIAVVISIWGLTSEFIQKYWAIGRNFDMLDWLADSIGALIAFIYCRKKYIQST